MRYEEDFDFENSYEAMTGEDARENELRPQSKNLSK